MTAALGARRLALATPYPETISAAARIYWQAAGFEVVAHRRLDTPNIYDETEATAYKLALTANTPEADTILISGTGLPTAGAVDPLEKELNKPVVTSQAATLWQALTLLRLDEQVRGFGRLLTSASDPR
ncbi:MAG TPA: hypothetical protein VJ849_03330 [Actinomycetes bacterium]|nr:hypothetical protein [Actinomycetes bacterium]